MIVYIMRGTTCSGKDHLINTMFDNESMVISSDEYRERLFGSKYVQNSNGVLFSHMRDVLKIRLSAMCDMTVWNATNLKYRDARSIVELCDQYHVQSKVISIQSPSYEELVQRNLKRYKETGFFVPEKVIEKHITNYKNGMDRFIDGARENRLNSFTEVDQNHKVILNV